MASVCPSPISSALTGVHAPAPPRYAPGGALRSLRAFQRRPLDYLTAARREHGNVVGCVVGPRTMNLVSHPDAIERVLVTNLRNYSKDTRGYAMLRKILGTGLVTSEGEFWKSQRRIAQPAFHRQRVANLGTTMTRAAERMIARWQNAKDGIDVAEEMMRVTLDIVCQTLLSASVDDDATVVHVAMPILLEHVHYRVVTPLSLPEWIPTPRNRRFEAARQNLRRIVDRIIAERREGVTEPRGDILDMFIEARDPETGGGMNDEQLRDEVMTMFLAGHETTANALTWTIYLLARHPKALDAILAELDAFNAKGGVVSAETLGELGAMRRTIMEAVRLFPPVWLLARRACADDVVQGYRIREGQFVFFSPYVVHRHPDFWSDPEVFNPDRFLEAESATRHRYAYFPFSGGQRKCIGDQFAMMETMLVLSTILRSHRHIELLDADVHAEPALTLRPHGGLHARLS